MLVAALPIVPLFAACPIDLPVDGSVDGRAASAPYAAAFDEPLQLLAAGEPMGKSRLYPSPVLFDVDGDGQAEIVIGDLFGHVHVSEKTPGDDPAAWGELKLLEGDGKPVKFSNW